MATMGDLQAAIIEGAVQRIRPKVMTIAAILFGLLPIMWSPTNQAGADVMKRIAAPMIGGVITSGVLELLIYPAIYLIWRRHNLPKENRDDMLLSKAPGAPEPPSPLHPVSSAPAARFRRFKLYAATLVTLLVIAIAGYFAWQKFGSSRGSASGATFATQTVNGLKVEFIHPKGDLRKEMNELLIEFHDAATGELVDVGTVNFDLGMNMPGMNMRSTAIVQPTRTAGQYRAQVKPDMAGSWTATLHYEGPRGSGDLTFSVNVKP